MLWRETHSDPAFRRAALEGLRQYQGAERTERAAPMPAASRCGDAKLLHYGTVGTKGPPVILIPSLINPPHILDLAPDNSLVRYLAGNGYDAHLLDWGPYDPAHAGLTLGGHVERILKPMLEALDRPPILVGYCLGGTLATAAAAILPVAGLVTIAAPWEFAAFPPKAHEDLAALWRQWEPVCAQLGYVPMEVLQSGFWAIDPARTVRKYADFGMLPPEAPQRRAFIQLEDWANQGEPLTFGAGAELMELLYGANVTAMGQWEVGGVVVQPPIALPCPTLTVASTRDLIVPEACSPQAATRLALDMGHVGMIVGHRARRQLWEPLSQWLSMIVSEC